jgi:hypothetical protein
MAFAYANLAIIYTYLNRDAEAQNNFDRAAELGFYRSSFEKAMSEIKIAKIRS